MNEQKQKTVLVIEDETSLLKAIHIKLEKEGFSVILARTAEEAYNLMKSKDNIDVIWLDHYLLGKENGLDFVTRVKKDIKYQTIPIFIVSNSANADKIKSYISLGVDQYYIKSNCRLDRIIEDIKKIEK